MANFLDRVRAGGRAFRNPASPAIDVAKGRDIIGNPQLLQVANALDNANTGMGSGFDFATNATPGYRRFNPVAWEADLFRSYQNDWASKKIVDIPVDDMLRNGWDYDGLDDKDDKILTAGANALGFMTSLKQGKKLERLFGGSAIFMGIADDLPSSAQVMPEYLDKGALKFINTLPRRQVSPYMMESNPLSARYGKPTYYWIGGQIVHHSRLIIFDGDPIMPIPSMVMGTLDFDMDGFGESVLSGLWDDIVRATGTRQAAMQLVQRAGSFLAYADLMSLEGTKAGDKAKEQLKEIVNFLNVYRGAIVHKDSTAVGDPIATITPSFGSVPELVITFLIVLSAAGDIPATRFLGQAPGGLNATGESDLENYYGRLESDQTQNLAPKITQFLQILGPSVFGRGFDVSRVTPSFEPLWSMSAVEQASVRTSDATTIISIYEAQLITEVQAIAELKNREVLSADFGTTEEFSELAPLTGDPAAQLASVTAALEKLRSDPAP